MARQRFQGRPARSTLMPYKYKRRRPSILRNFWIYRRLVGAAALLGMMLWFIWANRSPVTVSFPFGLGNLTSSIGVVILLSAVVGSLATILVTTIVIAARRLRNAQFPHNHSNPNELTADRPPPDYAAKTTEGFPNPHWSN